MKCKNFIMCDRRCFPHGITQWMCQTTGLSSSKLAASAEVNVHTALKQGVKDINKAEAMTVYKLARALHCSVEDLLEL